MLQEAVPLELSDGVAHLVADAAGVLVTELEQDPVGALRTTLLHVVVQISLGLEGLVA